MIYDAETKMAFAAHYSEESLAKRPLLQETLREIKATQIRPKGVRKAA